MADGVDGLARIPQGGHHCVGCFGGGYDGHADTAIEGPEHVVEADGVLLGDLHRLELLEARALRHAVLAVVEEVANIGDVADVAHAIAEVQQGAVDDIKADEGAAVPDVRRGVDGGTADVHADEAGVKRLEIDLLAAQGVVNFEHSVSREGRLRPACAMESTGVRGFCWGEVVRVRG